MLNLEQLAEINGLIAALLTQQVNGKIGNGILDTYSKCSGFHIEFRSGVLTFVDKNSGSKLSVDVDSHLEKKLEGPMVA